MTGKPIGVQILDAEGYSIHGEGDPFGLDSYDVLIGQAAEAAQAWVAQHPGHTVSAVLEGDIEEPRFVAVLTLGEGLGAVSALAGGAEMRTIDSEKFDAVMDDATHAAAGVLAAAGILPSGDQDRLEFLFRINDAITALAYEQVEPVPNAGGE
jgi:hypothetical protein